MILDDKIFVEQVKKDISWDKSNFEQECIDFIITKQRYVDLISKKLIKLKLKEEELSKKYNERYHHYKNEYDFVLNAEESKKYTEADDEYLKVKKEYNEIEFDCNYINKILENLKEKYWMMKLFSDYTQFINGER